MSHADRRERAAVVQGDRSVLLEVEHPAYEHARERLARFAEIEKSPEHVHTYRITDLSLWNAASAGLAADEVVVALRDISRFDVPSHVEHEVRERMARWGVCALQPLDDDGPDRLALAVADEFVRARLASDKKLAALLEPCELASGPGFLLPARHRGTLKQALLKLGYPVDDRAGVVDGEPFPLALRADAFAPYAYQERAARAFLETGQHGVLVLPCGAGKTVVAMMVASMLGTRALVLTMGREACSQWRRELLAKTTAREDDVGVYDSGTKDVGRITLTTYSMLTRRGGSGPTGLVHFDRLAREPWGLVVYDEVHLLPAPVFRVTAELQARRRLGLTATLVREDGREGDVFALIGPKRFDVPWRELEQSGHIAQATCFELRVPLVERSRALYAAAPPAEQPRLAAENAAKVEVVARLAERHAGDRLLVLGTYLESLRAAARRIEAPLIAGDTPHAEREMLYAAFRSGALRRLALSRVGNFAIDLPDANVLVQLTGTMGSRQEEAQRLGRVLRPKPGGATFYTLVTRNTVEEELALHRQLFLTEQGYRYFIEDWSDDDDAQGAGPTLH